jgi:hypothetical protein
MVKTQMERQLQNQRSLPKAAQLTDGSAGASHRGSCVKLQRITRKKLMSGHFS